MSVRFRIRTPGGQELTFASHETFLEFVRSGDLAPDDLVYDAETGSWSSARTSPAVLEVESEDEAPAEAAESAPEAVEAAPVRDGSGNEEGASPPAGAAGDAGKVAAVFGLDLAPLPAVSPQDAAKAFVAKMEAERQGRPEYVASQQHVGGLTREDSSTLASRIEPAPPPAGPATTPQPRSGRESGRGGRQDRSHPRPGPTFDEEQRAEEAASTPWPLRGQPASRGSGSGKLVLAVMFVAVLGAGAYFGYPLVRDAGASPDRDPSAAPPLTPPAVRTPVIESTPAAVRERARERFVTSTRTALRDLPNVPTEWGSGRYFAAPSDFPAVLDVWQTYLSMVRAVRLGNGTRYRSAYEAALDDAGVVGEARQERLSGGIEAFAGAQALAAAHFDRVEALASAAIQTHTALLEAEGLILFDPGGTAGAREGLGRGAYGRAPDSQQLLEQVLSVLSERLDAGGLGPRTANNVREWVWDGFLGSVTR